MASEPELRKGDQAEYRSGYGFRYSAVVKRVHRDGTCTVQLYFPLNSDGTERLGCFQGDVFRTGKCVPLSSGAR